MKRIGRMPALLRSRTFWLHLMLAGFVMLNSLVLVRRTVIEAADAARRGYRDDVSAADDAFARVIPHLPAHGRVGYLMTDFSRANATDLAALFHAQYALAPRLVVAGTQPDVVIAVARQHDDLPEVPEGFTQAQVFSGRLALYVRRP